jgi:hypothetical protein
MGDHRPGVSTGGIRTEGVVFHALERVLFQGETMMRTRLSWAFIQEEFKDVFAQARTYPRPSVVLVIEEVAERVIFSPWGGPREGIIFSPWGGPLDAVPEQFPYLKRETLETMNQFDFPMVIFERHFDGSYEEIVLAVTSGD